MCSSDLLAACLDLRAGLKRISGERIAAELFKLLAARRGVEVMRAVVKGSLFGQIADVVPRWDDLARLAAIETHLGHPGSADPVLRLAALAAASDDDCLKLDGRLKLSAHDRERMRAVIADAALINPDMGEARARQVLYRLGQRYRDAVLFKWARSTQATDDAGFTQLARLPERWPIPVYPLSGRDALACGLIPGPVIGQRLKAVEDEWVASGFSLDRARLLERLRLG